MKTSKDQTLNKGGFFSSRNIFLLLLVPVAAALIFGYISHSSSQPSASNQDLIVNTPQKASDPYAFDDPALALPLLSQLDEFEEVDPKYYDFAPWAKNFSNMAFMSLHLDEKYCDKHRAFFVNNTKAIFEGKNMLTDFFPDNPIRDKMIRGTLDDLQRNISLSRERGRRERTSWIDPRQNYYFISTHFHINQHFGKEMGCITQAYNHIPGHGHINRKDFVAEGINQYAEQYKNRTQCFNNKKLFPQTWVMYIEEQCKDFFAHFNSAEHARLKELNRIVYIRKEGAGAHNGRGVFLMDDAEEKNVTEEYDNGNKCGEIKNNILIQYFIPNPLLLNERKFHFRVYLFIASVNPVLAYYYDGYVKLSLHKYEANSNDTFSMITNTLAPSEMKRDEASNHGMNETELEYFQRWDFDRLQKYLLETGVVTDPHWIDNNLRIQFKKAMIHLVRMSQEYYLKKSAIFEMFGMDFLMDDNLTLWFIEGNSSPNLYPTYPETVIFVKKLLSDTYDIVKALTRSRAKRIVTYINELTRRGGFKLDENGELRIENLAKYREEFKQVIVNRFESEFEPSPDNGYQKIVDDHLEGTARYMGLIEQECL